MPEHAAAMTSGKHVAVRSGWAICLHSIVSPDWTYQLGEYAVDMAVLEISPAQPSIVVLGERTIFCFTEGGTLRFVLKLDYSAVCLLAYTAIKQI